MLVSIGSTQLILLMLSSKNAVYLKKANKKILNITPTINVARPNIAARNLSTIKDAEKFIKMEKMRRIRYGGYQNP